MKTFRLVPVLSIALFALAGCSGAEPDTASVGQRAQASQGYGYEFITDHVATQRAATPIPASVTGRLAPELIQGVVRGGEGALSACGGKGERVLRFTIHEDGATSDVHVDGAGETETTCLAGAISGLGFPTSTGGVAAVIYPLVF